MTEEQILDVARFSIQTIIYSAAPPLLIGLTVGVIVSIFQTVTSIQEPTLAFVPKILAVFLSLLVFGSWILTLLQGFIVTIFNNIPIYLSK